MTVAPAANTGNTSSSVVTIVDVLVPLIRGMVPLYSTVANAAKSCNGVGTEFVLQIDKARLECSLDLTHIDEYGGVDFALRIDCDGFNVAANDRYRLMAELKRRFGDDSVSLIHTDPNPNEELRFSVEIRSIF